MEKNNNIEPEIQKLSFIKAKINMPKVDVPRDYFDTLSDNILTEIRLNTTLNDLPKAIPFEVPTAYFDTLPSILIAKVKEPLVLPFTPKHIWLKNIAVAASILLMLGLGFSTFVTNTKQSSEISSLQNSALLNTVTDTEIENYVVANDLENEFSNETELNPLIDNKINLPLLENDIFLSALENEDLKDIDINTL
jgi:hypothetical protein